MAIFLSMMAGVLGVLQAGFNKTIADSWGFSASLLLNGFVFLAFNFLLFAVVLSQPKWFPQDFHVTLEMSSFRLWWILPGIFGFFLVLGLAVSIGKIGAVKTFIVCIAAQVIAGVAWDYFAMGQLPNTKKIIGSIVTLIGAVITVI